MDQVLLLGITNYIRVGQLNQWGFKKSTGFIDSCEPNNCIRSTVRSFESVEFMETYRMSPKKILDKNPKMYCSGTRL